MGKRGKGGRDPGGHQGEDERAQAARAGGQPGEPGGGAGPFPGAAGPAARPGSVAGSRRAADAALAIALSFPQ